MLLIVGLVFAAKKYDSYNGLVMAGYQGWHTCEGDEAGYHWHHYERSGKFEPGYTNVDFWPDVSEHEKTYETAFKYEDGTTAYVFSADDPSTQDLHFKWMQKYGIDGVFLQRFVGEVVGNPTGKKHFNKVAQSAKAAAAKYDRTYAIMYDLSGQGSDVADKLLGDVNEVITDHALFDRDANPAYLYHNGRPLIVVWGVGFSDNRQYTLGNCNSIVKGLKALGCSVMLGVPTYWRELKGDTVDDPVLHELIKSVDIIMPWFVGRFDLADYPPFKDLIEADIKWCADAKIDYAPLCFPGFSWRNMHSGDDSHQFLRRSGEFFWLQLSSALEVGAKALYIAMFDEIDEGTAIYRIAHKVPAAATGSTFVPCEDDIQNTYYMYLAGYAGKILRGEEALTSTKPVQPE